MSPDKISRSFANNLLRIMGGEVLPSSAFSNRRQLSKLEEDRVIVRMVTGRNRSSIRCPDAAALENYLRLHFGITDLQAYIELLDQDTRDGEDSLQATTSTKALRHKGLQGFFIKAFKCQLRLGGEPLCALPDGVEYFVHDPERMELEPDVLVVGIENPECFVKIGRLLHLFPVQKILFVLRYHSLSPVVWLETIENRYLHFGDFDPAGILIYCNEYLARLGNGRCQFFVPKHIEELIASGQTALFDAQQMGWPPACEIAQADLLRLIKLIQQYGKGAEQELLLKSDA